MYVITINQRYRRTDSQTTYYSDTALRTYMLCAVKTRMMCLPDGKRIYTMRLAVVTQY